MDQSVCHILDVVLPARSPQVPVRVIVTLEVPINCLGHSIASNVKFASLVEQGLLAVLLDDVTTLLSIDMGVADYLFDLGQLSAHRNAAPSVGVLAGFHDPDALSHVWIFGQVGMLHRIVVGFFEFAELSVSHAVFDVEGDGQVVEDVLMCGIVVHLHVVVDCLLVRQVEVVFLVVGGRHAVAGFVYFFWLL